MGKIIKKHSSFLAWVFLPSLLLVAAVLGVNIVSRPSKALIGSFCTSLGDCTSNLTNSCIPEFCSSIQTFGQCEEVNSQLPWEDPPTAVGTTCACNNCGNGRCEPDAGEDTATCPVDCPFPAAVAAFSPGCTATTVPSPTPDACCPANGVPPAAGTSSCFDAAGAPIPNCDPDCCVQCGDGIVGVGEQCDPGAPPAGAPAQPSCASGESCVNCQCVTIPTACPTDPTVPASEIQCIPDATTVGCENNCQCDPYVTEGGGTFGCGGREKNENRLVNAACVQAIVPSQSLVPPSLFSSLNSATLGGLFALFGVPGGVYAASRWRKKRK